MYTNMSLVKKKHKGNNSERAGKKNRRFIFALHLCSSWGAEFESFFLPTLRIPHAACSILKG